MGANVVTLPLKILTALNHHPLTDSGRNAFLRDWGKPGSQTCGVIIGLESVTLTHPKVEV